MLQLSGEVEDERHGVIRYLVDAVIGYAGDRNALRSCGFEVDVVHPHAAARENLAALQLRDDLCGEGGNRADDDAFRLRAEFDQGFCVRSHTQTQAGTQRREYFLLDRGGAEARSGDRDERAVFCGWT